MEPNHKPQTPVLKLETPTTSQAFGILIPSEDPIYIYIYMYVFIY